MPKPDQIANYWVTWSKVLTDGNFDPAGFYHPTSAGLVLLIVSYAGLAAAGSITSLALAMAWGSARQVSLHTGTRRSSTSK